MRVAQDGGGPRCQMWLVRGDLVGSERVGLDAGGALGLGEGAQGGRLRRADRHDEPALALVLARRAPISSRSSARSAGQRRNEASARSSSGPGGLSETSRLPSPLAVVAEATGLRSSTSTRTPRRVSASTQAAPMRPLPTTTASGWCPYVREPCMQRTAVLQKERWRR